MSSHHDGAFETDAVTISDRKVDLAHIRLYSKLAELGKLEEVRFGQQMWLVKLLAEAYEAYLQRWAPEAEGAAYSRSRKVRHDWLHSRGNLSRLNHLRMSYDDRNLFISSVYEALDMVEYTYELDAAPWLRWNRK